MSSGHHLAGSFLRGLSTVNPILIANVCARPLVCLPCHPSPTTTMKHTLVHRHGAEPSPLRCWYYRYSHGRSCATSILCSTAVKCLIYRTLPIPTQCKHKPPPHNNP